MKVKIPTPSTLQDWLEEIARGYNDAKETVPFAKQLGRQLKEQDFFQLAPLVCLKFRGLSRKFENQATEAALSSYVSMESHNPEVLSKPHIAFAFVYLASHYGLDLLTEGKVAEIMDFIAGEQDHLAERIAKIRSK